MMLATTSNLTWKPWLPSEANLTATYKLLAGNRFIISEPTFKQLCFLCYPGLEAMYGGAGGGGKSEALLMASAMYVDYPDYAALILRRSYQDLVKPGALIDRSKSWWHGKVQWNEQNKTWTFPSGAKITFGYLENENDKYQYQSAEFQLIAFDELTQFSESQYTYLFSRLRKKLGSPLPLRMRSATNPGGKGHTWVKDRFVKAQDNKRPFFPAKIKDNPYVNEKEYLESLKELDPTTRNQMEKGDWTDPEGGLFRQEWMRYYRLKENEPRYAYFDGELIDLDMMRNRFLTVDPAATEETRSKDDPDWTVVSAWGVHPLKGYLVWLGCRRVRVDIPDIPRHVGDMYDIHKAEKAYIEGFGIGKGPAQLCKRHKIGDRYMNIIEFTPKGKGANDKLHNSISAQNLAEAGRLWLPLNDPLFPRAEVLAEVIAFTGDDTKDAHDDIVDTLSKAAHVIDGNTPTQHRGFAPYMGKSSAQKPHRA